MGMCSRHVFPVRLKPFFRPFLIVFFETALQVSEAFVQDGHPFNQSWSETVRECSYIVSYFTVQEPHVVPHRRMLESSSSRRLLHHEDGRKPRRLGHHVQAEWSSAKSSGSSRLVIVDIVIPTQIMSKWMSSFWTTRQHILGHLMPLNTVIYLCVLFWVSWLCWLDDC